MRLNYAQRGHNYAPEWCHPPYYCTLSAVTLRGPGWTRTNNHGRDPLHFPVCDQPQIPASCNSKDRCALLYREVKPH